MAKVALRFGCDKQSKNLQWYLVYHQSIIVFEQIWNENQLSAIHNLSTQWILRIEVFSEHSYRIQIGYKKIDHAAYLMISTYKGQFISE